MYELGSLEKKWNTHTATLNAWLSMPNAVSAEVVALQGFDSITIDMQHGLIDYRATLEILQATARSSSAPLVRLPSLDASVAMHVLDAGAVGVICPSVDSEGEAVRLVKACRYPPVGHRSVGPTRASSYYADYLNVANESVLVIAQIESAAAGANLEEILCVPGLNGIYVGPADLALSMGRDPRVDHDDPVVVDAIATILKAAGKYGVAAGIHCGTVEYARKMIGQGFNMVTVQNDMRLLAAAESSIITALRTG